MGEGWEGRGKVREGKGKGKGKGEGEGEGLLLPFPFLFLLFVAFHVGPVVCMYIHTYIVLVLFCLSDAAPRQRYVKPRGGRSRADLENVVRKGEFVIGSPRPLFLFRFRFY